MQSRIAHLRVHNRLDQAATSHHWIRKGHHRQSHAVINTFDTLFLFLFRRRIVATRFHQSHSCVQYKISKKAAGHVLVTADRFPKNSCPGQPDEENESQFEAHLSESSQCSPNCAM